MGEQTYPGLHDQVIRNLANGYYTEDEEKIIRKFGLEWYVTKIGQISVGKKSYYKFASISPTKNYQEMFNFEKEIVIIFSPYETLESRTIDAFEEVLKLYPAKRVDKICGVLISKDQNVEQKISNMINQNEESKIIIPLSYNEIMQNKDTYFLRNRFRKYFYERDLFAFESPLKTDLYFFGSTNMIHTIVNRHKGNENSGLFGMRKSGKTSTIYGIQRVLETLGETSIIIDCQSPAFHLRKWNQALFYIIDQLIKQYKIVLKNRYLEDQYTELNAAIFFEEELKKINEKLNGKSILLIFDEIENITFEISPSKHWSDELDFLYFWQTIRSIFQKTKGVFSFLIVGTNPMCVERTSFKGKDNPIYNSIPYQYIEKFDVPQTREMVRKLGRYMGLKFDETIYSKLTEDYGGHPYLIRHCCSVINKLLNKSERPVNINRLLYENAKKEFDNNYAHYVELILDVLIKFYKDEYELLEILAVEDYATFGQFAIESPHFTNHLKGYGIIYQQGDLFDFKIDAVKKYLISKNKFKKKLLSLEEKWNEISQRRIHLEIELRKILRNQLKIKYGEKRAREIILNAFGEERKEKYSHLPYKDLLDGNKVEIYFNDLTTIILKEWELFKYLFSNNKTKFEVRMNDINIYRRKDAHSQTISDDDLAIFRMSIKWLEQQIEEYIA